MLKNITSLFALFLCTQLYAGKVDTLSIMSTAMHKEVKCVVVTPLSYENAEKKYPVIYLLHGYSGSYAQWIHTAPQLKDKADQLQVIFVCPDGGFSSWYFDSENDTTVKYETFVSKELVNFIDKNYRSNANKNSRAITGLSMGGHGALYLALKHPDVFGACGATSGGVDLTPFPNNWQIKNVLGDIATSRSNWEKNSVINMVDSLKDTQLSIIIDCGTDDFFLEVNRNLHKKLLQLKISHDYIERPGTHNGAYWKNSIDYQLIYFKKFFGE
jgi:S-formylglutathione hydrolase FrmB